MVKKVKTIMLILIVAAIVTGCERTEEEAFAGVEDVADKQQINMHFAWRAKDKKFTDLDTFTFSMIISKNGAYHPPMPGEEPVYDIPKGTYSIDVGTGPTDGRMGITVFTEGNHWKIGNLYYEPALITYGFTDDITDQEIIENASWVLYPNIELNNYHIWLDEYVDMPNISEEITPLELFTIKDTNSGIYYVVTLVKVYP